MATLFSKENILSGEEREAIINFSDLYEIPEDVEEPYVKIRINDKTREHQSKCFAKYIKHRIVSYGKKSDRFQIVSPGKMVEYVIEMLRVSMIEMKHLIDDTSLPVIRKKLNRSKALTKFLAERITEEFEKDSVKIKEEEEEDEKN
jgi:hypothetical protein